MLRMLVGGVAQESQSMLHMSLGDDAAHNRQRTGMWSEQSEIMKHADRLGIKYRELDSDSAERIRRCVEETFCKRYPGLRLFERIRDCVSITGPDVWKVAGALTGDTPVYVFFEPSDSRCAFLFESGLSFTSVHGKCANFTVYITNDDFAYVIASSVEDSLVVAGSLTRSPLLAKQKWA